MYDIDRIDTQEHSVTATVCENARLFGATPERGEFDPREVWDRDDALDAVGEAFRILTTGVAPDGFQLADEREPLLWGFVNCLRRPGTKARPKRRPARARAPRPSSARRTAAR